MRTAVRTTVAYAAASFAFVALLAVPFMALSNSTGAPAGRAGDPPVGATCATSGCHGAGNLNNGPGQVSVEVPATYAPGDTLTVAIEVTQNGITRWGFQVAVRDANEEHVGALQVIDGGATRTADALGRYITHTRNGTNQNRWTVGWVAPDEEAGPVTFYVSGMAANGNGSSLGDDVYTATATVAPGTVTATETVEVPRSLGLVSAYPNPAAGRFTVAYDLDRPTPVTLTLVSLLGEVVWQETVSGQAPGRHHAQVGVAGLAAGLYHLEVRAGASRLTRAVTVVR